MLARDAAPAAARDSGTGGEVVPEAGASGSGASMTAGQAHVAQVRAVGEGVVAGGGEPVGGALRRGVVDVPVLHRIADRLLAVVPAGQVGDRGVDALPVDDLPHRVGLLALEEHDADPPVLRIVGLPRDLPRLPGRLVEGDFGLIQAGGRGAQRVDRVADERACGERITVVGRRPCRIAVMVLGELKGDLSEVPGAGHQVPDDLIHSARVLDGGRGVREPTQGLSGFAGIGGRVVERRHDDLFSRQG